jgi:hypothetical protein
MSDEKSSVHSPAKGLTEGFNVGGSSNPGEPSFHPDVQMTERGAQAPGVKEQDAVAGVGATSGAVPFAQLSTISDSYTPGDGDSMVGGLGTPPRP